MVFKVHATIGNIRLSGDGSKIMLNIPSSENLELAKMSVACNDTLLLITVDTQEIADEAVGQKA